MERMDIGCSECITEGHTGNENVPKNYRLQTNESRHDEHVDDEVKKKRVEEYCDCARDEESVEYSGMGDDCWRLWSLTCRWAD